jgi:hypothetical protein
MAASPVFAPTPPCTPGHCPAKRRHRSRIVAIAAGAGAGLVVGGVVIFIALRRRRRHRTSPKDDAIMRSNR